MSLPLAAPLGSLSVTLPLTPFSQILLGVTAEQCEQRCERECEKSVSGTETNPPSPPLPPLPPLPSDSSRPHTFAHTQAHTASHTQPHTLAHTNLTEISLSDYPNGFRDLHSQPYITFWFAARLVCAGQVCRPVDSKCGPWRLLGGRAWTASAASRERERARGQGGTSYYGGVHRLSWFVSTRFCPA